MEERIEFGAGGEYSGLRGLEVEDGGSEPRSPPGPVSSDGVMIALLDPVEGVVTQEPWSEDRACGVWGSIGSVLCLLDEPVPNTSTSDVGSRERFAVRSFAKASIRISWQS